MFADVLRSVEMSCIVMKAVLGTRRIVESCG